MSSAIIVGRARGALAEYSTACSLGDFDFVIVIGKMIVSFPDRIDHAVSFHAELFDRWALRREHAGLQHAKCYWGATYKGRNLGHAKTRVRPLRYAKCVGGSSGFLATEGVALRTLGVDRVVLAGVPMLASAGHEGDAGGSWDEADHYWATWEEYMPRLLGRVRSMSGRTRDALGYPDKEWMCGDL